MKRKYCFVFLVIVLYLIQTGDLFAQYCLSFSYDNNGNRIERWLGDDCNDEKKFDKMKNTITSDYVLDECVLDEEMRVFPNPTSGCLTVQLKSIDSDNKATLNFYNMNGVKLVDCQIVCERHTLDISCFPRGVYLMKVEFEGYVQTKIVLKL